MKYSLGLFSALFLLLTVHINSFAQSKIDLNVDKVVGTVSPTLYGVFFEDINFAADGGIYAELIKNRSFEFREPLMGWSEPQGKTAYYAEPPYGRVIPIRRNEKVNNRFYAEIRVTGKDSYLLDNEGFTGIGYKKGLDYNFSIKIRAQKGDVAVTAQLLDSAKHVIGEAKLNKIAGDWKYYTATITSSKEVEDGSFRLKFTGKGQLDIDMVSLFPTDTWKNRKKGLRADMVQALKDLKPGFIRFPGGCVVQGHNLNERYQWKKTLGPIENRPTLINRWNYEQKDNLFPDYYQTFGLGYYEYFQLAEDLGAEPLPIENCGMSSQFNTGDMVPLDELQPYIQDALDLIEFANGSTDTKWGKVRADLGHPKPFNLHYIGVGNEQWGPQYFERYKKFEKAIRAKYPNIKIVSTSGPLPDDTYFDMFGYAQKALKTVHPDLVDEHYYPTCDWFLKHANRYDSYDRNSYKVFVGEYAGQSIQMANLKNVNNWKCALSEAAYMTGFERNADVVGMTCYAPLFKNVNAYQWNPDLIAFNNLNVLKTGSYYIQKMYSNNVGSKVVSLQADGKDLIGQNGIYGTASIDTKNNQVIVKLVNVNKTPFKTQINLQGIKRFKSKATKIEMSGTPNEHNTFKNPNTLVPTTSEIKINGHEPSITLDPESVTIIRLNR